MTQTINKTTNTPGKVYLVGAGPGAVDLITVRGAKLLEKADIVFYDALVDPEMLELCPQAIQVAVGKRCGKLSSAQQFINKRLVDAAQKHQVIVRLKGGDPMLFGRADEEIQSLKDAGIAVEVVPGITAALAGAASIQQSLTLRGVSRSVAFITLAQGTENITPGQALQPLSNPNADTLVYYMGRKDAALIAQQLIEKSLNQNSNTPVQILEAVSTPRERLWTSTLEELAAGKADQWFDSSSPALIMIGEALGEKAQRAENSERPSSEVDNRLQDGQILTNGRRRA
ncbi:uroporphyrinogen-III C-methyltransferase [Polynucleobacter sp. JS-Polo-80-F4]|uniref:uroporphyrinogen-III C-methyltransferase n=1 Tax=Polynucleobacter sp. JS-Polo-80-F4 TaxID=2576918 RepID=UPI001C0BD6D2|nr:uroporphyrinogen-III C-methyltransferase [Polynucleobacter sp. JS-Polo-80-F4]MBU3616754.1 uroporphyrinogen-III C-methyltransferase [Polynucleobacter sp. JS-Polo-80-F4]